MADPSGRNRTKIEVNAMRKAESVSAFSVLCVFISLVSMLADLTTVILVLAEYCNRHYFYWAIATSIFILAPNILINIFSLRWHLMDNKRGITHWLTHCTLFGFIERYVTFLHKAFWCKNFSEPSKDNIYLAQRNDLNLLHFLYTFTGTVPQIILQTYAVIVLEGHYQTRVISLCASTTSVCWACITYVYSLTSSDTDKFKWPSVFLQTIWHLCMLIARVAAVLLFMVTFGMWTLVPLGIHWAAMTFWIVTQKTTFCPNKLEETLYNVVMGFIYCFCYINLREGHTRYRLMMFYTLIITQNFGSLLLYILLSTIQSQKKTWSIASTICIVAGTFIGMCSMLLYYRWFHARGPIVWKNVEKDTELNNTRQNQEGGKKGTSLTHVRSFKSLQKEKSLDSNTRNESSFPESLPKIEIETTDKKVLLDHWIARAGTPTFMSAPIGNNSLDTTGIEMYTVENTPQSTTGESIFQNAKFKKKTFCSPTELNLKLSSLDNIEIDEIAANNINNIQKRRGICSSDELRDNFELGIPNVNNENFKVNKNDHCSEMSHDTDGSNKKTSSGSIDMDLDLSFSDINSSDINTFNENIVQKLCLSALKNIKVGNQDADIENIQRIALDILKEMYAKKDKNKTADSRLISTAKRDLDTPTEMLSVHDYENICAVNIAREAWGLRSWNVYSDIENWLHDGSVFRERTRDNLTSGSSEISSCLSHELKNSISLTPSAFPPKRAHTYSNVVLKYDKSNQGDYVNTMVCPSTSDETFTAKPCMIDNKDNSQLEPIIEELDDLGDIELPNKKRLNSESSLVATIDEIRKTTASNSPNVYHRRDYHWNVPQFSATKLESNLKRALWKEPSKFNPSNIMEALPEKENNFNMTNNLKLAPKKELNIPVSSALLEANVDGRNIGSEDRTARRKQKSNNLHPQMKKMNNRTDDQRNFSNDIDYLWQLVSEKSMSHASAEDLTHSQLNITSSLQSLIAKDNLDAAAINVASGNKLIPKKATRSKPRRKFSILRERFEPRAKCKSDEEALYQYNEKLQMEASSTNVVNVINKFDLGNQELQHNKHMKFLENQSHQMKEAMLTSKNIKEKRSQFMKQVLTPTKFNTKLRKF